MNGLIEVSGNEMMEVDGGRGRDRPRHERSGAGQYLTAESLKEQASFATCVIVGAWAGGPKGTAAGAILWTIRKW